MPNARPAVLGTPKRCRFCGAELTDANMPSACRRLCKECTDLIRDIAEEVVPMGGNP